MKIGLYTFAAVVLMILVGAAAYTFNADTYLLEVMGMNINLPIAVWVVIPMFILFVFTFFHMLVYGLKGHFTLNRWKKDAQTLDDALYWALLNEPKEQKYLIESTSSSASLLSHAVLKVTGEVSGLNPRLNKIMELLQKIDSGEYVDLKEQKLAKVLNEGNPYLIQNRLNRLDADEKFVEKVMKSSSSYSEEVQSKALELFAEKATFNQARAYVTLFDMKNFLVMLNRVTAEERLGLTEEILKEFIDALEPTCSHFLHIAEMMTKLFTPDENLAIFKAYQAETPKAQYAYLYLLFEYELMDEIGRYLDEQEDSEFMRFRALYTLKQTNANYKFEDIINNNTVCSETDYQ